MDATQATAVNGILLATMAGALIVLAGALYAAVFAIGKIFNKPALVRLSYLFYAVLVVAVLVLDRTLGFTGAWDLLIIALLAGYLFAPPAIWKLCEGTHAAEPHDESEPHLPAAGRGTDPAHGGRI